MDDNKWYDDDLMEEEGDSVVSEYDITSTPNDFNISTLFSLINNGVIKIPPFQRNYVWDEKKASRLIESIILGLPVPQIFLYEQGKNNFYVIDGQQRLLSIYFFMKQRFPTKEGVAVIRQCLTGNTKIDPEILNNDEYFKDFSLNLPSPTSKEQNPFNKLKYETLNDKFTNDYKYTFEILRTIRSVVIKLNDPEDDSSIYEIFNRLNTGGQNLSPQEIRMSLYYSDFYKMLFKINAMPQWRDLLCQKTEDVHFKDIEILLRSFAVLCEPYGHSLKKFLNTFSKKANLFNAEKINYLFDLFVSFLDSCSDLDDGIFFTKNNKFSISLFESVFVAAARPFFEKEKTIDRKIKNSSILELKEDSEFINANQRSADSKPNVNARIDRAVSIVKFE